MKRRRVIWFAVAFAMAAAVAVVPTVREWLAVDACLDGGGAWVKQTKRCSHDQVELDRHGSSPPH
ncbi:hypothetical protein [Caulobacter sp. 1776]|uniref:hypothetical protein n=1 Tax=Caulobacter sp. 1776 TaxID=3156420 RepID=UPI0033993A68